MKARDDTKRYSIAKLKAEAGQNNTATRVDAPEYSVDPEFWEKAQIVMPASGKASVHLRLDKDVLEWFRSHGQGHLTRMNAVLRSYVEAQKRQG